MKKYKKIQKGREENSHKTVRTASLLILTVVFALVLSGAVSAGTPLQTNQTGTVSGDLYVNTTDAWPSSTQGATNEVTQANTLPVYTSIDSAYVYVNVYSGSGTNNWPVRTTVKLDSDGDGVYETTLSVEDMNIPGTTDGTVYWLNDHCNRVYSDYQVWYNVTGLITSTNPSVYVKTESMGGDGYDGRIKMIALAVAYNDGDQDKIHYYVLNGQDWINTGSATSTFNTSSFTGQVSSATLNTVALVSTDGTYSLNGTAISGNLTETGTYYKEHQWDVANNINAGANTNITYTNVGSSFKINLATLTIREVATVAPVADFTTDTTGGASPLTVNFTNTSTGTITSYAWDFNNDGTTDSTDQNPSWIYNNRGTYTVKLTVNGPGGTDTATKTDLINVTGPRTWIVAADGTGDYTTLQAAFNSALLSGDTIYIKEGTYTLTYSITSSLTNITINSEGTDKVTLNMRDTNGGHFLHIGGSGWTLENLRILNCYLDIYGSNCTFKNNISETSLNIANLTISSSSSYNLICNNTFPQPTGNYGCIYISNGSNYNEIRDNLIIGATGSYSGMTIYGSYNVVENNTIRDGSKRGLTIYSTGTNNTIRNNSFLNNAVTGIMLSSAGSGNQIYLNTFSGNGATISLSGTKPSSISWVSPSAVDYIYNGTQYSAILGNYWGSSYAGLDDDHNGIGDVAYTVPSSLGSDTAPLMYPFSGYSLPVVDFSATPLSGAAPLSVSFTNNTQGYISSYAWDFNNDGTTDSTDTNPTWIYNTPGIYTVKLTATNPAGSDDEVKTDYVTVLEPDTTAPIVTATPTTGNYNPPMQVTLSATDNADLNPIIYYTTDGTDPTTTSTLYTGPITLSENTTVKFIATDISGNISPVQSETYTMVDTEAPNVTASQSGTTVTLSATDNSDTNPAIYYTTDGTDPTTNSTPYSAPFNIPRPAITLVKFIAVDVSGNVSPVQSKNFSTWYSTDILTGYYAEGNVGVIVSNGGTRYGWFAYNTPGTGTVTYTASSLNIPAGATILSARLYQAWTWWGYPGYTLQFNGQNVPITVHCPDGNDGQDVFDVTSYFNANGDNTAVITSGGGASYGTTLIVVYQSTSEPYRKIWVNEGFDIIPSYSGYGATEGPGHAFFQNVTNTNIGSAQIITSLPSGDNDSPNILLNGQTFTINSTGGSDPAYKYYNITPTALQNGLNTLEVPNGGYMSLSNAILTLTIDTTAPIVTANPTSGTYNTAQSVSLTATDDQDISPDIYFTVDGTDPTTGSALYSGPISIGSSAVLKFLAVDDVGNASAVQSENYIIDLIPIAQFVGTPTSGSTPLQVAFTNTSLNTNTYQWDFDNNGTVDSTDENPTWTYNTAGTYTVKLTVTGPLGSDEEVKTDYITANLTITNPRTGQTYTNIQGAVADALDGDTLTLQSGTYTENITINKQLTLNSAGAVTIQAANVNLPVFNVEIAGSGSTITGFTITGATNSCGINLDFADNCNINNNVISGNLVGVKFFNSNNNNLSGNTIQNNTWAGICLDLSTGETINANEVTGNQEGIFLANSSTGNVIQGNNIHNNTGTGVNILSNSNGNTVENNCVSGNGVMGLLVQNSNNNTVAGNTVQNNGWAGIVLDQATGNTINNSNEVSGSHEGIFLANNSNSNIITGNNIHNNTGVGVSVLNSNSNQILSNTASANGMMGIFIQNSNTNTLSGNTVQNNGWTGICLDKATSNTINNLNLVTGNQEGIFLANNSSTNTIENNQVNSNTGNGICILNSNSNTINSNQVNNNGISGIFIQNSTSTVIYHNTLESNWGGVVLDTTTSTIVHQNNFINNTEQALAANGTANKFYQNTTGNYYNDWTTTQRRIIDGNENTYDHYPHTIPF